MVALYFLLIAFFGVRRGRIHGVIISLSSALMLGFIFAYSDTSKGQINRYVDFRIISMIISVFTAKVLMIFSDFDSKTIAQSSIYLCIALCNAAIAFDLSVSQTEFTLFFYKFFDEMVIILCLLQMYISHAGFTRSLGHIQPLLYKCIRRIKCAIRDFYQDRRVAL